MEQLLVKNKRILDFYSQNPSINFEAVNLIFVELFEKLLGDMNKSQHNKDVEMKIQILLI